MRYVGLNEERTGERGGQEYWCDRLSQKSNFVMFPSPGSIISCFFLERVPSRSISEDHYGRMTNDKTYGAAGSS